MERKLFALLEEAYLRFVRRYGGDYGWPARLGGPVWGVNGVFDEFNRLLKEHKMKPLSWREFKKLLDEIDRMRLWGRVHIDRILAPNGRVEPHTIIFYHPVFKA